MRSLFIRVKLLLLRLNDHRSTYSCISWSHSRLRQNALANISSIRTLGCSTMGSCLTHAMTIIDKHVIVRMVRELISGHYHFRCVNWVLLDISVWSLQLTIVVCRGLHHHFVRSQFCWSWINTCVKVKLRAFSTCVWANMALTWVILYVICLLNNFFIVFILIIVFEFI